MGQEQARPGGPFSALRVTGQRVEATLLRGPSVEGLEMAIYLDGSGSMDKEYTYKLPPPQKNPDATDDNSREVAPEAQAGARPGFFARLFGWLQGEDDRETSEAAQGERDPQQPTDSALEPSPADKMILPGVPTNEVEPQVRWMLEYLASRDRNGVLRVAYWACGVSGSNVEVLGELKGAEARTYQFPGPKQMGAGTVLTPALKDFVSYLKSEAQKGAQQGCAIFITDGRIQDVTAVKQYSGEVAKEIIAGRLPRLHFILVGVGEAVSEAHLQEVSQHEHPGVGRLWSHRAAREIRKIAALVEDLVEEALAPSSGATIYDEQGAVLARYEGRLPEVLSFTAPEGAAHFTVELRGQRYTLPLQSFTGDGPP